ncbi:ABC transporter substrate-binding protein [Agrobacterium tumefaciens]|uniref:ABC transporter substrate-binding protein n=1 Tax=Agrobacterium tumefaciens TaxID=358 RepID=UPI0021CEBACB|nr:extracellular solute-binding protein [Agrobacterium tumefaciens]UXS12841.1 extracellular solute-binding protein [Agrobacterium tumefaciens]UXS20203.1 extracellular solute-binding protein [Agrobacterium tumefaciens]UXT44831.1 extracellular solute-binding protein [Agrobacterium tumefaciens]UXT52846.1 extracellular solute-binding protein [Agrobacterium tumefaciens]
MAWRTMKKRSPSIAFLFESHSQPIRCSTRKFTMTDQFKLDKSGLTALTGDSNRRSVLKGLVGAATATVVGGLATPRVARAANVVRFLHDETDPPTIEFFNKAIAAFEKDNPGVTIEMEAVGTAGRLQKVAAMLNAGTMPEIFKILPEERFSFGKQGFLEPLDDVIAEIGVDEYPERMIAPIEGNRFSIPYTIGHSSVFWYRDDLLTQNGIKPPKDWAEYLSAAKELTSGDQYGTVFPANKNRVTSLFFSQYYWSAGGTYFDKDLNLVFGGDAAVKALEFQRELAKSAPPSISSYVNNDLVNAYLTEKVAIDIWAGRLVSTAALNKPDLIARTKAAKRPAGPAGVGVGFSNANSLALASEKVGATSIAAAKKFLTYILTGDRAVDFALTAYPHLIPPTKSVRADSRLLQGTPQLKCRSDLAEASFDISNTLDFESEAGARIVDGKVVTAGVVNPLIGDIIARDIPAQIVQRVLLQGAEPSDAVAWGRSQMEAILAAKKG